jgi:hypothetical protein
MHEGATMRGTTQLVRDIPEDLLAAMKRSAIDQDVPLRTWILRAFEYYLTVLERKAKEEQRS